MKQHRHISHEAIVDRLNHIVDSHQFTRVVYIMFIGFLLMFTIVLNAYSYERDQDKESVYYRQLEKISPEAVKHFRMATEAMDNGKKDVAAEEYLQVLKLHPDFVPALRRLSYVVDDPEKSLTLSRKALSIESHPYNKIAVVRSLLAVNDNESIEEALTLSREAAEALPEDVEAWAFYSQVCLSNNNIPLFEKALSHLKGIAPDEIATHYYLGIKAIIDENWQKAETEILKAQALGMDPAAAKEILDKSGVYSKLRNRRYLTYLAYTTVIWLAGFMVLLLTGTLLSKVTLITVEKADPQVTGEPSGSMRLVRRLYTIVLGLTSIYFYISLPIVLLLVIVGGGGLIYSFFILGHIPIKLVAIIAILMLVTVYAMIKSLFIRPKDEDPGQCLEEHEAPEFYAVLREVAEKVNTPMVDSVFIVPDATIAVFERGSFWKRLSGQAKRCLIIGIGLLEGMTQLQLKAILAHEFGHLNNKDTAGGSLALHIRNSIHASANALAQGGAATWYNPAWLFINGFYRVYLRVSQGASRLQEVLADRWAALIYGARSFSDGLKHAVRRGIEFDLVSNLEIGQALQENRQLKNLYALAVPDAWPEIKNEDHDAHPSESADTHEPSPLEAINDAFKKAMEESTSEYDSHPAPKNRIDWVNKIQNASQVTDNGTPAVSLFRNIDVLKESMTRQVYENVQSYIKYREMLEMEAQAN